MDDQGQLHQKPDSKESEPLKREEAVKNTAEAMASAKEAAQKINALLAAKEGNEEVLIEKPKVKEIPELISSVEPTDEQITTNPEPSRLSIAETLGIDIDKNDEKVLYSMQQCSFLQLYNRKSPKWRVTTRLLLTLMIVDIVTI